MRRTSLQSKSNVEVSVDSWFLQAPLKQNIILIMLIVGDTLSAVCVVEVIKRVRMLFSCHFPILSKLWLWMFVEVMFIKPQSKPRHSVFSQIKEMSNYLTVPAAAPDSPTMTRARLASGKNIRASPKYWRESASNMLFSATNPQQTSTSLLLGLRKLRHCSVVKYL